MPLQRLSLFLVVSTFYLVTPPATLAGCGVNFEKMKTRRIEAIRGQILSKLGFTELPSNDQLPARIPEETEALYNRTRDFVEEQARKKREECLERDEDYYAQEIVTVYAKTNSRSRLADVEQYKSRKLSREVSEFFDFELQQFKLDPDAITSASLRFHQVQNPGSESGITQQIDLYQLTIPEKDYRAPGRHFLTMRLMDTIGRGWQSFDVTSTVREWIRFPNSNLGLELTVPCPEEETSQSPVRRSSARGVREKIDVLFTGSNRLLNSAGRRGDRNPDSSTAAASKELSPHLVIMTRTAAAQQQHNIKGRRRNKRSLDAEYCFNSNPSEPNCCLRELYIDFRKDLKWDWVHAPAGYNANFCAGACPYLWSMDSQHATILSLYKSVNPQASSSPCCVPKDLNPLTIMFYSKGRFQVTQLTNMVLLSCKCS